MPQNFKGFRVGMADGDGLAPGLGQCQELVELLVDRGQGAFVVEKDIAIGGGDALLPCQASGQAPRIGEAVDEEEVALRLDALHQPVHGLVVGGEQTAHVVVDADDGGQGVQAVEEGAEELLALHAQTQTALVQADLMQGLHGQVQDDFPLQSLGLAQQALAVRGLGQDGEGDVAREVQGLKAPGFVIAQVVDDDGDAGIGQQGAGQAQQQEQEQAPAPALGMRLRVTLARALAPAGTLSLILLAPPWPRTPTRSCRKPWQQQGLCRVWH